MAEFAINGVTYQSKLMDGETQTLVLKRLLPAFTAMIGVAEGIRAVPNHDIDEDGETPYQRMSRLASPVAQKLADVRDDDVKFVLNACLDVTTRQASNGVGWVGVRQNGIVQDRNDAKFITRLTIAWNVLSENFGDMLGSLGVDLAVLKGMAPAQLG